MSRIVVGVDGSPPSFGAVVWATARAEELGWSMELVHVLDDEWGAVGAQVAHDEEHVAARLLAATADSHPSRAGVSTRLVHGSTVFQLSRLVGPDDLLVVGSHKTGYIRGRALGSLSIRLAPMLRCSMLVIPDAPLAVGRRGVVLGVGPDHSPAAVRVAVREARSRGDDLTIIAAADDQHRAAASAVLDRAASEIRAIDPDLPLQRRVSDRRPAEALLDASRKARLLVLGAAATQTAGSTTHEVLINPLSAVWIAR